MKTFQRVGETVSLNYEIFKESKFNQLWWGRNRPEVVEYERKMAERLPEDFPVHPKEPDILDEDCGGAVVLLGFCIGALLMGITIGGMLLPAILEVW